MLYRYPQIRDIYVQRLRYFLAHRPNEDFRQQLLRYFSGETPHSRDLLASLLQVTMGVGPPAGRPSGEGNDGTAIQRVSLSWPDRAKNALLTSLDCGTFENICITVSSGPESTEKPMYFAGAVDVSVGPTISRCKPSDYHKPT